MCLAFGQRGLIGEFVSQSTANEGIEAWFYPTSLDEGPFLWKNESKRLKCGSCKSGHGVRPRTRTHVVSATHNPWFIKKNSPEIRHAVWGSSFPITLMSSAANVCGRSTRSLLRLCIYHVARWQHLPPLFLIHYDLIFATDRISVGF